MATGKTYKSFHYSNSLVWDSARRGHTSAPGKPDIEIGSPPEFKGEAGVWAPEEMLVAALNACMMLTFVAFAQGKRLAFVAYESAAEGLLENVDGKYRIVEVSVRPKAFGPRPVLQRGPAQPVQKSDAQDQNHVSSVRRKPSKPRQPR